MVPTSGGMPAGPYPCHANVVMAISNHDGAHGSMDGPTRADVTMAEVEGSGVGLEIIYQVCELC